MSFVLSAYLILYLTTRAILVSVAVVHYVGRYCR